MVVPSGTEDVAQGMWRDYYRKWGAMMLERLDRRLIDMIPALSRFIACQDVRQNEQLAPDRRSASSNSTGR